MARPGTRSERYAYSARGAWRLLLDGGPLAVLRRLRQKLVGQDPMQALLAGTFSSAYDEWLATRDAGKREEPQAIASTPLVTILMPVHDPPPAFLRAAVDSVRRQTYGGWELCIVDDASNRDVAGVLDELARLDHRVRLERNATNEGIARSTNRALAMARGEYVGFLDHDDLLAESALASVVEAIGQETPPDLLYSDRDAVDERGRHLDPYFKPDWSPLALLSHNYVVHFLVLRTALLRRLGGLRPELDGAQDYDLILRIAESQPRVRHIPRILYSWRRHAGSNLGRPRPAAFEAGRRALVQALQRRGLRGSVETMGPSGPYRVRLELGTTPSVSIIVSSRDVQLLAACTDSIGRLTTYPDYEIVVATNAVGDAALESFCHERGYRLVCVEDGFFSRMNNVAAEVASGEYLLFLNDDTEVMTADWLEEMVSLCQLPSVVAVGPRLVYPNGRIQFTRVVMGIREDGRPYFFDPFDHLARNQILGFSLAVTSEVSAVSGGCMLTPRLTFVESGGFDSETFGFSYQDADWFLRMRAAGGTVLFTPHATVKHYGSFSKKRVPDMFSREVQLATEFFRRHVDELRHGDPYYNANLLEPWGLLEAPEFPGLPSFAREVGRP